MTSFGWAQFALNQLAKFTYDSMHYGYLCHMGSILLHISFYVAHDDISCHVCPSYDPNANAIHVFMMCAQHALLAFTRTKLETMAMSIISFIFQYPSIL